MKNCTCVAAARRAYCARAAACASANETTRPLNGARSADIKGYCVGDPDPEPTLAATRAAYACFPIPQ